MKTDSIFYRLFQEIPSIFFELIGNSPQLAELYQFSSVEIIQQQNINTKDK
jgi:predicted transposase YdaD